MELLVMPSIPRIRMCMRRRPVPWLVRLVLVWRFRAVDGGVNRVYIRPFCRDDEFRYRVSI